MKLKQIGEAMGPESQDYLTISNKWGSVDITLERDYDSAPVLYYLSGDADGKFTRLGEAVDKALAELAELQRGRVD